jgi:hypothetical protein
VGDLVVRGVRKQFFFEKKNQEKLFRGCRPLVRDSRARVFAFFFQKKRFLA